MSPKTDKHLEGMGKRLRFAREGLGLTTRAVASRLGKRGVQTSHVTIGNYERGRTRPPEEILQVLADIYNRSLAWIRGDGTILKGVRYRAPKSVGLQDRTQFTYQAQLWLEIYFNVESLLDSQLRPRDHSLPVDRSISGKDLADRLRRLYKFDRFPIPSTIHLLEDFGVHVIQMPTDFFIDAFAARFGESRVVVLNSSLPNDRLRLTALHELAHHIYEDCLTGTPSSAEDIELRAFEFGSHVLIPEDVLQEAFALRSMVRLVQFKERYGVSLAAMIYRARKSAIISQRLYQRLWRDFARLGIRKNEPGHVAADRPLRMETLIDVAVQKKRVTYTDIAARTGTDEETVRERVLSAIGAPIETEVSGENQSHVNFEAYKREFDIN